MTDNTYKLNNKNIDSGSDRKYRLIFENAPLGILHFDNNGVITECNSNFVEIVGSSKDALIGINMLNLPDQKVVRAVQSALEGNMSSYEGIYQSVTADKTTAVSAFFAPVMTPGEKFKGGIGVVEDISPRKKAEETLDYQLRFQQLTAELSSSFISASSENIDEKFNRMLREIGLFFEVDRTYLFFFSDDFTTYTNTHEWCAEGIAPQIDQLQNLPADYLPFLKTKMFQREPVHIPDIDQLPEEAASEQAEFQKLEINSLLNVPIYSGERLHGFFGFDMVRHKKSWQDTDIGFLRVLANILADAIIKVNTERSLLRAKEKAEESDRLKSAFLANVSHEIRTPMNGILGFLDLLKSPSLEGAEKDKYIEIVNQSGQRLLDTINDIIEISRIESGQMDVKKEEVDVFELLNYHYTFFKPKADARGLALSISEQIPAEKALVYSDRHKLDGMLTNLLNNAIKFTSEGYIEFGNYINNDGLVFFVRDTGIGITPDQTKSIFRRFVQADLNLSRKHEGSGLGLPIVKAYIEMLHGHIHVDSTPGEGSTFYVIIPYNPVKTKKMEKKEAVTRGKSLQPGSVLLIAEDDEMSYLYLKTILEDEPVKLIRSKNGEQTVKAVRENPDISLVLMDLKMPDFDGLKATQKIREFNQTIPVIAQTAHALSGDKKRAIDAGCNDYISKPINRKALLQVVHHYIGKEKNGQQ